MYSTAPAANDGRPRCSFEAAAWSASNALTGSRVKPRPAQKKFPVRQQTCTWEGVTDFWILSAVNGWLKQNGAKGTLPADLALTPVGGAGKMTYMAALLTEQRLNVFALLDGDRPAAMRSRNSSVESS